MEETLINIPISFLVWLVICTIACFVMLIVQIGFNLNEISKNKKDKEKDEIKMVAETRSKNRKNER